MSLTRKGLLLLIAVLAIQLLFNIWLGTEVTQAESRARDEDYSKTMIGRTNYAGLLVSSCNLNVESYAVTGDQKFVQRYASCKKKLLAELQQMKTFAVGTNEVARITDASTETDKLLNLFDQVVSNEDALKAITANRDAIETCWNSLYTTRQSLLKDVNLRFKANASWLPEARAHRKLLQFSLLGVNSLTAISVFAFFLLGIVKRLKVIEQNSLRFTQKEKLLEPISGNDEVAKLDKSFHDMAISVERAHKQKEEYMSMLGHDVRSPLTSVMGSFELLRHDPDCGELSEFGVEVLSRASRNIERILKLVNEMLLVESFESGVIQLSKSENSVADIVENAVDSVTQLAQKREITIEKDLCTRKVKVDKDRLSQVLINLLNNAIKFAPNQSKISVAVEDMQKGVKFSVSDEGRGVPDDAKTLIFERFKQVKPEDASELGGAGLGLPICKMIVEAHGGSIGVEARTPTGACFWFIVPN